MFVLCSLTPSANGLGLVLIKFCSVLFWKQWCFPPINRTELHSRLSTSRVFFLYFQPPREYLTDHEQYNQLHIPKRLDDAHSDMSGDSAGDSGKGGSDDDLHSPVGLGHDGGYFLAPIQLVNIYLTRYGTVIRRCHLRYMELVVIENPHKGLPFVRLRLDMNNRYKYFFFNSRLEMTCLI